MFEKLRLQLVKCIKSMGADISLDELVIYDNKKIEIVLSTPNYIASLSILEDFTYDFLLVKISNEEMVMSRIENYVNFETLLARIEADIGWMFM